MIFVNEQIRQSGSDTTNTGLPRASKISVILPAYNEGKVITEVLTRLSNCLEGTGYVFEIIVVSDGSADDTTERAQQTQISNLKVVEYFPNKGKGFALREGFGHSSGEVIAFYDGDLDIHPDSLLVLLEILKFQHADVVIASKTHPNSNITYPIIRRIQSKAFKSLVRLVFDLSISDTQTGLKIFKRECLEQQLYLVTTNGFAFDLELLARLSPSSVIIEGPVEIDFKFDSKIRILEPIRMLFDVARIRKKLWEETWKTRRLKQKL